MKSILRRNKKGSSLGDTFVIWIFFVVTLITAGICLFIYNTWTDAFTANPIVEDTVAATETVAYNELMRAVMDPAIITWLVILWLGSIVTSAFLDNSPVWFIIFFLLSVISLFALAPFSNIISDLSESDIASGFTPLPMSMFISNNLLVFITAYILSISLALFIKTRVA